MTPASKFSWNKTRFYVRNLGEEAKHHLACRDCENEQSAYDDKACLACGSCNLAEQRGRLRDLWASIDAGPDLDLLDDLVLETLRPQKKKRVMPADEVRERLLWDRAVAE